MYIQSQTLQWTLHVGGMISDVVPIGRIFPLRCRQTPNCIIQIHVLRNLSFGRLFQICWTIVMLVLMFLMVWPVLKYLWKKSCQNCFLKYLQATTKHYNTRSVVQCLLFQDAPAKLRISLPNGFLLPVAWNSMLGRHWAMDIVRHPWPLTATPLLLPFCSPKACHPFV